MKLHSLALVVVLLAAASAQDNKDMNSHECSSSGNRKQSLLDGIVNGNLQGLMKPLTKTCLDADCPPELHDIVKKCLMESIKRSTVMEDLKKGMLPEKAKLWQFYETFELCKLDSAGVAFNDTSINTDSYIESLKLDKWTGNQEDIKLFETMTRNCLKIANGTTAIKKMISAIKCGANDLIQYCESKNKDPGMMLIIAAKFLTSNDESKCAPVEIPAELKTITDQCMADVKSRMGEMPAKISKLKNPVKKMKKVFKRFLKGYIFELVECSASRLGFYNNETNFVNITAYANYVKSFRGWEGITQERDMVYNSITECGKLASANDTDSEEDSGEMESDSIKDFMKGHMTYDRCFSPKFSRICGINNNLSSFFYPLLNRDFMKLLGNAFMETGGEQAKQFIETLKKKFENMQ